MANEVEHVLHQFNEDAMTRAQIKRRNRSPIEALVAPTAKRLRHLYEVSGEPLPHPEDLESDLTKHVELVELGLNLIPNSSRISRKDAIAYNRPLSGRLARGAAAVLASTTTVYGVLNAIYGKLHSPAGEWFYLHSKLNNALESWRGGNEILPHDESAIYWAIGYGLPAAAGLSALALVVLNKKLNSIRNAKERIAAHRREYIIPLVIEPERDRLIEKYPIKEN